MTGRWREENYFRYARAHFDLDSLDNYAVTPDDPDRMVPSPAKKTAAAAVKAARKALADAGPPGSASWGVRSPPGSRRDHQCDARQAGRPGRAAAAGSKTPRTTRKRPPRYSAQRAQPGHCPARTETKLITHAIRMASYNAETILARALNGTYARAGDEACALIREALTASGDIIPGDGTLTIRLDPLSAPRRTRAIAALCGQLNTTRPTIPAPSSSSATKSKTTPALHKPSPMSGVLSPVATSHWRR